MILITGATGNNGAELTKRAGWQHGARSRDGAKTP